MSDDNERNEQSDEVRHLQRGVMPKEDLRQLVRDAAQPGNLEARRQYLAMVLEYKG
jgi:hypothetical protein